MHNHLPFIFRAFFKGFFDIMQHSMLAIFTTEFCLYSCLSIYIWALKYRMIKVKNHSNLLIRSTLIKYLLSDFCPIFWMKQRRWCYLGTLVSYMQQQRLVSSAQPHSSLKWNQNGPLNIIFLVTLTFPYQSFKPWLRGIKKWGGVF